MKKVSAIGFCIYRYTKYKDHGECSKSAGNDANGKTECTAKYCPLKDDRYGAM